MEGEDVLFRYSDYRRQGQWFTELVHAAEFIRRFLLHVLPYRFVRIRYFGLLANRQRQRNLEQCRKRVGLPPLDPEPRESFSERCQRLTGYDPSLCPSCKEGRLVLRGHGTTAVLLLDQDEASAHCHAISPESCRPEGSAMRQTGAPTLSSESRFVDRFPASQGRCLS